MDKHTAVLAWFELVKAARRQFRPEQYSEWQFITGCSGTQQERYLSGLMALDVLQPGLGQAVQSNIERELQG